MRVVSWAVNVACAVLSNGRSAAYSTVNTSTMSPPGAVPQGVSTSWAALITKHLAVADIQAIGRH